MSYCPKCTSGETEFQSESHDFEGVFIEMLECSNCGERFIPVSEVNPVIDSLKDENKELKESIKPVGGIK